MKMSDIFKLPFVMKEIEKDVDGISTIAYVLVEDGGKRSYNTAMLGYEKTGAQWIVDGLNAHDTQLADIDRLLAVLKPFATANKSIYSHKAVSKKDFGAAATTYTELRETYPKVGKDGNN